MIPDPRRLLSRHAGQLCRDLEDLTDRLKSSTAEVVAGAAASLVNAAVNSVLGSRHSAGSQNFLSQRQARPWQEGHNQSWQFNTIGRDRQELDDDWRYQRDSDEDDLDHQAPTVAEDGSPGRSRWLAVVLAAFQAAGWWLRRSPNGLTFTTVGVGLAAGAATLALGVTPVTAILTICELLLAGGVLLRPV
jgi:hypothetical protein